MTVSILTFTSSEEEITSGIPRFMTIESNVPATIYFTLDGTTPTTDSAIYIDTFEMPDGETSVILSAFGINADNEVGSILTQIFATDSTRLNRTRHLFNEGVVVDRINDTTDEVVAYDADGVAATFSDITNIRVEEIHSAKGRLGIADGVQIQILTPAPEDTPYPFDDDFQISSSPSDSVFNPYAKTIIVDEREDNVVRIINRPFGSMRNMSRDRWGQAELNSSDSTYISGGFVRRFYSNVKKNTMGSYYYDNNTNRWVIGLQALPDSVPRTGGLNQSGQPLVFRWLPYGRHSTIPV